MDCCKIGRFIYEMRLRNGLTQRELAGGYGNTHYLYTGQYYWALSPSHFNYNSAYGFNVSPHGILNYSYFVNNSYGVRPSVSLAKGTKITGGDGSYTSPYIIDMDS